VAGLKSVRCRQIETTDLAQVVDLLTEGFRAQRRRAFWTRALERLADHQTPTGFPRFGYLLESGGAIVGVILLIFTRIPGCGTETVRCNLSSWYVADAFRPYAPMLISRALKHKEATYLNLTPAPHTFPILDAQGFQRYCEGRFLAIPAVARSSESAAIEQWTATMPAPADVDTNQARLLQDHAAYGCISVMCRAKGVAYPFVFAPRRKFGVLPLVILAYCCDIEHFVRFAGPLGRFLLARGYLLVSIDADAPIGGLIGYYDAMKPKYWRGANKPRLGDTSYTERTMFGS
jgi:hypothetical protein